MTKPVYALTQLGEKTFWNQVGVAFPPNQDGSVTIQLNCVPLSGKIQIRDKAENSEEQNGNRNARSSR